MKTNIKLLCAICGIAAIVTMSCSKSGTAPDPDDNQTLVGPQLVSTTGAFLSVANRLTPFDLDGDGKTDIEMHMDYIPGNEEQIYIKVINAQAKFVLDGFTTVMPHKNTQLTGTYPLAGSLKVKTAVNATNPYSVVDTVVMYRVGYGNFGMSIYASRFTLPPAYSSSLANQWRSDTGYMGYKITNSKGTFYGYISFYMQIWTGDMDNQGVYHPTLYWDNIMHWDTPGKEILTGQTN